MLPAVLQEQEFLFEPAQKSQTVTKIERIVLYTDGGCRGNPGPGAWAAVSYLECRHTQVGNSHSNGNGIENVSSYEMAGSAVRTTNNQMELQAVIEGLQSLPQNYPEFFGGGNDTPEISIHTDSQYVKNGITSWIHTWKKNSWRTSSKKPVKNQKLWQELDRQSYWIEQHTKLQWHWVKGHAGLYYNERCDQLVRQNFLC